MIDNQKIIKAECIEEKVLYRLHKNYHDKAINILNELNPSKVNLYDYVNQSDPPNNIAK